MSGEELDFIYASVIDMDTIVKPMLDDLWDAKHKKPESPGKAK